MLTLRKQILSIGVAWTLALTNGHDGPQFLLETYGWGVQNVDNYLTVGWNPVDSVENLHSNIVQFVEHRDTIIMPGAKEGFKILHLPTKSGAELWGGATKDEEFFGNDPHYSGPARMRVNLHEKIEEEYNEGGFICDEADVDTSRHSFGGSNDNSGWLRNLRFFCPTFQLCGTEVIIPCTMNVQICAFAIECKVFDSTQEYDKWNQKRRRRGRLTFADQSFAMDSAFRGEEREQYKYCAIFSGRVVKAVRKVNERTGEPFFWVLVETLGDHQIDMVVHPMVLKGNPPRPGSIILGSFFLSGRLMPE
mmetsp:Transcript_3753/g.8973  ORF Transcript_3753/g.8973 Transcript_3753/m.8973 type:complete len:306 (+) Transcript_3753:150-1067(+)